MILFAKVKEIPLTKIGLRLRQPSCRQPTGD